MTIRKSTKMLKPSDLGAPNSLPLQPPTAAKVETWAKELFWHLEAQRERTLQTKIGPSELGDLCDRQLAFKVSGVEPRVPDGDDLRSLVGTALHDLVGRTIESRYGATHRYLVENRVEYRGLSGTCDLFDRIEHRAVDWKTTSEKGMRRLRASKFAWKPSWIVQTNFYGAGMELLGERVEEVAIVILPREGTINDIVALVRPYDRAVADAAIDRLVELEDAIRNGKPIADIAPHPSGLCSFCPFYRPASLGVDLATGCPGSTTPDSPSK